MPGRLAGLAAAAISLLAGAGLHAQPLAIVAGPAGGTAQAFAADLARSVASPAGLALEARPGEGTERALGRLRAEPGVALGIVQGDVVAALAERAAHGDAEAGALLRPLRVVLPLYARSIVFVVRADANLHHLHEIRDARISFGPPASDAAFAAANVYRLVAGGPLPAAYASYEPTEDALVRLVHDRTVDAVAIVAAEPARILAEMKPEARSVIALLAVDPRHPSTEALLRVYESRPVRAARYPNLLDDDLPGLAVRTYLVTNAADETEATRVRFARALCRNAPILRATGDARWQEVALSLPPLPPALAYDEPSARELRACLAGPLADSPPGAAGEGGAAKDARRSAE